MCGGGGSSAPCREAACLVSHHRVPRMLRGLRDLREACEPWCGLHTGAGRVLGWDAVGPSALPFPFPPSLALSPFGGYPPFCRFSFSPRLLLPLSSPCAHFSLALLSPVSPLSFYPSLPSSVSSSLPPSVPASLHFSCHGSFASLQLPRMFYCPL